MRTTVLAIVLGFLPALFAADPGDPSPLAVPPDKTARAVELARQLDDDDIRIRDRASEELAQLGRFALPAIRQTLTGKRSVEVKNRIERLMPGALAADFAVRYPVFLADVGRKFDHDFLGWSELKAITMDTEASRTLFADMLADENTRSLLLAMVRPQPEAQELFQNRWTDYGLNRIPGKGWEQLTPPLHDLAALLLAQTAVPGQHAKFHSGGAGTTVKAAFSTEDGKLAAVGKGRYGTVIQSICRKWVETREHLSSHQLSDQICRLANLGEEARTGIRFRIVDDPNIIAVVKQQELMALAQTGGRKHLNRFRKFMKDESLIRPGTPDDKTQLRDMALVASILVTDQKARDYGFTIVVGEKPEVKFMYFNYRFTEGKGKSMDDLRKAAFAKWAEWEKTNLKPDEK